MKKFFTFMLCMMFALGMSYAQTTEETVAPPDTPVNEEQITVEPEVAPASESVPVLTPELKDALFEAMLQQLYEQGGAPDPDSVSRRVPIVGKSNFARHHFIYQTLEVSAIADKAKDEDEGEDDEAQASGGTKAPNLPDIISQLGIGMNIGYSVIFVPGKIKDDMLELNRFGFAYSTGFIASFHKLTDHDVTCNLMAKFGVETGNNHALGIGADFLVGGGKGIGTLYTLTNVDWQLAERYSQWCFKLGGQIWLNTNLLTTAIKNTDVLAFARFIKSYDPNPRVYDNMNNVYDAWIEESWQFGITFRYRF